MTRRPARTAKPPVDNDGLDLLLEEISKFGKRGTRSIARRLLRHLRKEQKAGRWPR